MCHPNCKHDVSACLSVLRTDFTSHFFFVNFYLLQQTIKKYNKERAYDNLKMYNTNTNVLQTKIDTY